MKILLNILNQEYISDIYIGVTGILIAIVIFIAEIISQKNNALYKKVILYKTRIKGNIIFTLVIFLFMLICNSFDYDVKCEMVYTNVIYIIFHVILLILVLLSMYKTGRIFWISIKLNIEENYFNEKLEEYVYKKAKLLEKKANKRSKHKLKKEQLDYKNFLKDSDIFFNDKSIMEKNNKYEPIFSLKNGIIKTYDYKKIYELINFYKSQKASEKSFTLTTNNIVYIPNKIGEKVNKKEPIFYCLKEYKNIFKNLNDMIIYTDNRLFINDEIKLINKCLFDLALDYSEPDSFDENNRLFNYFNFLYKNKLYGIKQLALDNIEETFRKIYKNYAKNASFCSFLNSLSLLAYTNGDYEDYAYINDIKLYLYIYQLKCKNVDVRKIAYNFANNAFRFNMYSVKKNEDIRYYDNLMSLLLKFIIELIKNSYYMAIEVLLNNISMEVIIYKNNEFDKKDIINFQFACGIIYCLIILAQQSKLKDKEVKYIKNLIDYIDSFFINISDAWITIQYFKQYFNKSTCVQRVYEKFDFEFVNHDYQSTWGGLNIDERLILKEVLYIFNISYTNINSIEISEIKKDDEYFYQKLLDLINSQDLTKIEEYLKIKYDKSLIIETLNFAIEEANKKQKEYNRTHELSKSKVNKLKKLIIENIEKHGEFIEELKHYKKIQNSETKLNEVYGINQLIPREIFFDEICGYEELADNFSSVFETGMENEYIKKLDQISKKSHTSLENELKNINIREDYILISNYINNKIFYKLKYNYQDKTITINNKQIKVLNLPQIEGIYLISTKNLPIIEFCKYSDEWDNNNIINSIYYEFDDCAENDKLRKELLENTAWLKEKGDLNEQENYLKETCRIRIYLSFKIKNVENSIAIKFENA